MQVPPGRDWESEVLVGVHTHPSMNHLHVHVLSRDRHSERMKHRKHYNSFATPFFVPVEEFPLRSGDARWGALHGGWRGARERLAGLGVDVDVDVGADGRGGGAGADACAGTESEEEGKDSDDQQDSRTPEKLEDYLSRDLACWRCGRNFGNQFARLKAHLGEEFEAWKRE